MTAATFALVLGPVLFGVPAQAAPDEPPADMSEIGGELLGRSGTQVHAGDGVPRLPRDLSAKAWIVADAESGEVLAAHNAHWPLAPASTIKMLFADTLLTEFEPDEVYLAKPEHFVDMGAGSSAVGISDGHTYTVEDLWHGVFLASGNDAVHALTAMNGGREKTVAAMNERAEELQAHDTHVVNPDGYDARRQTSSAYDLTLIARAALRNEDFRDYVSTPRYDFPGQGRGAKRETYEIQSTNRLLVGAPGLDPYPGIAGIKNGYTSNAGYTFTGVAEREGRTVLVTVMDPSGRGDDGLEVYRQAAALLDWGFEAAGRAEPVGELVPPLSEIENAGGAESASGPEGRDGTANAVGGGDGSAAAEDDDGPAGGVVLAATAAGLAAVAAGAYVFHRRRPLALAALRTSRTPGTSGTPGPSGPSGTPRPLPPRPEDGEDGGGSEDGARRGTDDGNDANGANGANGTNGAKP
ncbi:D-alanyl-D-alanine carboxypeptidase family protein [Streptomyces sp. 4N509B]|uniref:D-alanyl-D-alanine carboxypeptidase family protein n=1 Tax=Streptomyces sp. 4N509B TaxID=3457413 RepID=UPI003FD12BC8